MKDSFFHNLSEDHLAFSDVVMRMRDTKMMPAIHLHRIGKGAWGCLYKKWSADLCKALEKKFHKRQHLAKRYVQTSLRDF